MHLPLGPESRCVNNVCPGASILCTFCASESGMTFQVIPCLRNVRAQKACAPMPKKLLCHPPLNQYCCGLCGGKRRRYYLLQRREGAAYSGPCCYTTPQPHTTNYKLGFKVCSNCAKFCSRKPQLTSTFYYVWC